MDIRIRLSLISGFVLAGFLAGCLSVFSQTQPSVSISPSSQTVNIGRNVNVSVIVANAVDLYAAQISFSYNPSLLQYNSVQEGTFLSQSGAATTLKIDPQVSNGVIKGFSVSRTGRIAGVNGSGTLATFNFTGLAVGTSTITLSTDAIGINGVMLINSGLNSVAYTRRNGTVTVRVAVSQPSLVLTKQVDKTSAQSGDILTYTITYRNVGTAAASSIAIAEIVPQGTVYILGSGGAYVTSTNSLSWSISSLAANQSGNVNFRVLVE